LEINDARGVDLIKNSDLEWWKTLLATLNNEIALPIRLWLRAKSVDETP
jgi:hypothetical protein